MTTEDVARDMDSIRAAFSVSKINYYAFSYGTYIGQVYATLFPERVRRMVLDSTVDPTGVWYVDNVEQDYAFQGRMDAFFAWVAKYDASYDLGSAAAQVQAAWYKARNQLLAHPVNGMIGADEFDDTYLLGGYQDLALVNELTVYHNMFLNRERVRWPLLNNRSMRNEAKKRLDAMGLKIPNVNAEVAKLSGGQRQAIAVARSVYSNPKILLLDEPLAAMGVKEGAIILDLVRELKEKGDVSIIIIAHNYGQVLEVCNRVNLIQGGQITLDKYSSETSAQELTDLVVAEYRKALEERQHAASA